jgi:hypothetical protein
MKQISIVDRAGLFAENKDVGRDIRIREILPALEKGEEVVLDFEHVETATQSFVHALISEALRQYKDQALDRLAFKSCNDTIKKLVSIVVDYMQDAMDENK